MSMWSVHRHPVDESVGEDRQRFHEFTLPQLRNLPPGYSDWIQVYVKYDGRWVLLQRTILNTMMVDKSLGCDDADSRAVWNDLRVFIPEVEKSSPLDSIGKNFRALHLDEVVGIENLWAAVRLPEHLHYLQTYVSSGLQNSLLPRLPDFYVENVKVMGGEVVRIFRGQSNKVIVFRPIAATRILKVTINSYLLLGDGLQEYKIELIPSFTKGKGVTLEERMLSRRNIFLGPIEEPTYHSPMKILVWNCRGAGNTMFWRNFNDLIAHHKPSVVIVTETRVTGEDAFRIVDTLQFDSATKVDSVGYSGGVWMLWKSSEIVVEQPCTNDYDIFTTIKVLDVSVGESSTET